MTRRENCKGPRRPWENRKRYQAIAVFLFCILVETACVIWLITHTPE